MSRPLLDRATAQRVAARGELRRNLRTAVDTVRQADTLARAAAGLLQHVHVVKRVLAGLALGIAVAVDAVSNPLIGSVSDRWRSRLGCRHPFMWSSIVPLCASFYLLFEPPVSIEGDALFWCCWARRSSPTPS